MKDKFIIFILGVMIGAAISTGAFFVYTKTINTNSTGSQMQMPNGTPPSMPNGDNSEPPEMPNNNTQQSN